MWQSEIMPLALLRLKSRFSMSMTFLLWVKGRLLGCAQITFRFDGCAIE